MPTGSNPNALPAASALEAARATVAEMTPFLGVSTRRLAELLRIGCRNTPPVPKIEADFEADAAGIVLALQTLHTLTDEAAVEGIARVLEPDQWAAYDAAMKDGVSRVNYEHWSAPSLTRARAIITHILTAGRGV